MKNNIINNINGIKLIFDDTFVRLKQIPKPKRKRQRKKWNKRKLEYIPISSYVLLGNHTIIAHSAIIKKLINSIKTYNEK